VVCEAKSNYYIRQRGNGNPNPVKLGRRIKELERLYGIRDGSAGGNGSNQHIKKELEPNSSAEAKKSQADLAAQMGISVDTLNNYKKLTELIPELEDLIDIGILAPTTALALVKYMSPLKWEETKLIQKSHRRVNLWWLESVI
jgi:hypothetical protein